MRTTAIRQDTRLLAIFGAERVRIFNLALGYDPVIYDPSSIAPEALEKVDALSKQERHWLQCRSAFFFGFIDPGSKAVTIDELRKVIELTETNVFLTQL